ncbi:phosphoadenylyl-sulfate reductase [Roseateles amylovorans]|uniref:Adenosine 5'-phosphosulfate reductase n=1 Tax=Roseateles amylovorans TaxID=2978473 RepID=A0ABY6B691_9BURK|nr:phosphoadenylyl-sulfate reductase [Roseateles amylovorans]UXH79461.1 phosphoadenylyl-sulfate reductase [Roseateles amylovorans]
MSAEESPLVSSLDRGAATVSSLDAPGAVSAIGAGPGAGAKGSAIGLYARATPGFDERLARTVEVLRQVAADFGPGALQSTSLGVEDMVITDLIARHHLPIALATLDTGMLHDETLALIPRIRNRYGLEVEVFTPVREQVLHFVRANGEFPMTRSVELRKACCGVRKLEPLSRMLTGRSAWITGLRREQSANRADVPFREDDGQGRTKINPLAEWRWADVWHYVQLHDVPYNPLHDQFMPSIGCAPCTRAIAVGEDFRAGRWWWEDSAKECGLHASHSDAPSATESPTSATTTSHATSGAPV